MLFYMNPLVSIVIPVYNVESYLDKCMQSLTNQTYPKESMEIIAINDGSTDGSLDILQSYADDWDSFRIVNQENKGPGAARNVGIDLARGKYIYFLDSDDWISPNLLSDCVLIMESDDLQVCHFQKYFFRDSGKKGGNSEPSLSQSKNQSFGIETGADFLKKQMDVKENCTQVWLYFIKTAFLRENNLYFPDLFFLEDIPFIIRMLLLAERFMNIKTGYYIRRLRSGSIMTSMKRLDRADSYISVLEIVHSFFDEMNQSQAALLSRYMMIILNNTLSYYRLNEIWERRSELWSVAKMTKYKWFLINPEFLGVLFFSLLIIYRRIRRFAGGVLESIGLS